MKKKNKSLILKLKQERDRRFSLALHAFSEENDIKNTKHHLEWIQVASQLISINTYANRNYYIPALITLAVILIVGLFWTFHLQSTDITIDLVCQEFEINIDKDWSSSNVLSSSDIFIKSLSRFYNNAINTDIDYVFNQPSDIHILGNKIKLSKLFFSNRSNITFSNNNYLLKMYVKNGIITGNLFFHDGGIIKKRNTIIKKIDKPFKQRRPNSLIFETDKSKELPIECLFRYDEKWRFESIDIKKLSFLKERPPNSGKFESTIITGNIKVMQNNSSYNISNLDYLTINKIFETKRFSIIHAVNEIRIIFEGKVSGITIGPKKFQQNIMPSYLSYFYNQQKRSIFWVSLIIVIGFIFNHKEYFFDSEKWKI